MNMFFYIFQNTLTKYIKIGITENIARRSGQLERSCGCKIWQVAWLETHAAATLEKFILDLYDYYREEGEWLNIPNVNDRRTLEEIYTECARWNTATYRRLRFFYYDKLFKEVDTKYILWVEDYNDDEYENALMVCSAESDKEDKKTKTEIIKEFKKIKQEVAQ